MNSVERAIRAALAKGSAGDRAFRRRIYASASAALERSLTARVYSDEEIFKRRRILLSTVKTIESEFLIVAETQAVPIENAGNGIELSSIKPVGELDDRHEGNHIEALGPKVGAGKKPAKKIALRKSRPWLKYALNSGFLVALVWAGFWAYGKATNIYAEATNAKQPAQKPILAESSDPNKPEVKDWIQVFDANNTDLLSVAQGAKAEITSRDGVNFVVMAGDGTHEVALKIGAGLMQTFAGKRVLFNFKARSVNGATLDTGVHCQFGEDTNCERKRFKIGPQTTEYMFAVYVSASASGDGALLIAPDLSSAGGEVEIENIRAAIVELDAG